MSAREIIADELDKCICPADPWAGAIINCLHAAGYHILGPDEVEDVRRVVEIANRNEWSVEGDRIARALGRKA